MYPVNESRITYRGIIVNVRVDDVVFPNGKSYAREVVEQRGSTAILLVDEQDKLILVRQYRHPVGRMSLEIPAGILDGDEDPLACVLREAEEETGFVPRDVRFVCAVNSSIGISTEQVHIFIGCDLMKSIQSLDDDEFLTIERHSLDDCLEMVKTGEISAVQTVVALFAYKCMR